MAVAKSRGLHQQASILAWLTGWDTRSHGFADANTVTAIAAPPRQRGSDDRFPNTRIGSGNEPASHRSPFIPWSRLG
jgi:hypothetical protein